MRRGRPGRRTLNGQRRKSPNVERSALVVFAPVKGEMQHAAHQRNALRCTECSSESKNYGDSQRNFNALCQVNDPLLSPMAQPFVLTARGILRTSCICEDDQRARG
jgi:hypothetical protein